MEQHWIPLGGKRAGMVADAVAGTVSLVCIIALVSYCTFLVLRHHRRSAFEKVTFEEDSRALRFLSSSSGVLFFNLLAGNALESFSFILVWIWISRGGMPSPPTPSCTAEGVFLELGAMGGALGSTWIALAMFAQIVWSYKVTTKVVAAVITFQWIVMFVMAAIGPLWVARNGGPFYASAGGWCWISKEYEMMRLYLRHLWVFSAAAFNLILYSIIAYKIVKRRRAAGGDAGTSRVVRLMLIYPLIYIVTVTPLAVSRLAAYGGKTWPPSVLLASGCVAALTGTFNCALYAFSRAIITFSPGSRTTSVGGGGGKAPSFSSRPPCTPNLPSLYVEDRNQGPQFSTPRPTWSRAVSFVVDEEEGRTMREGSSSSAGTILGSEGDKKGMLLPM
ncbi:hypothetical protein BCR35DRAFT_323669 [Leucosporidium creatinivorum]|uniref:G protein-coupled receptor GPR1/2/3 C-terminal domain-containing protein n=1 Tax=Leucosporidium creatinivorum TaxID=106004 RepID=A0A1Y2G0K7_9BASI|nr:hypothetical protein BCR35DRAFT_323669 [Leucosporidium creatinivorum]